jgi:hypothetical protein
MNEKTLITTVPKGGENIRLIPVPGEKINDTVAIGDIDCIEDKEGALYRVLDFFIFDKYDTFPGGLMLIATGTKDFDSSLIWDKYKLSKKMYFFICKKEEK